MGKMEFVEVILLLGNTSFNNLQNSFDILSYFFDIGKT
jgi:hypothetical protein